MAQADFIIIGAGIAGASAGYWLSSHGRVIVLERESQPGYHSTGRSAALFMESYGTPQVRALTLASRAFFESPPAGFCEHPLISKRGAMMVAGPGQESLLKEHWDVLRAVTPHAQQLSVAEACAKVPVLRPEKLIGAVYEPGAMDMDVHAIHQGFLRGVTRAGGSVVCNAAVTGLERVNGQWLANAGDKQFSAPVILNAAGAWVDQIGTLVGASPIGLQPKRRSAMIFAAPDNFDAHAWPMVGDVAENWYFKPDAGMLLGSPANADPVGPQDIQPEELDIATAIYHLEDMTTLSIRRPTRTWAGLRSFVADGDLVGGFDATLPGFFWVAAQGGYGIQTSPAMGEVCAALARGQDIPERIASFGLTEAMLSPKRPSLHDN